jgi:hypothetical protein
MNRTGGMGMRKHGRSGHSGHNADMIQTARMLNREAEELKRKKNSRREPVTSVKELFRK